MPSMQAVTGRDLRQLVMGLGVSLALLACSEDSKLKVNNLDPSSGDAEGGQYVTVKGNRFQKDGARSVKVYFGGVRANVVRWESDSELTLQAPAGKSGSVVDVEFEFEPGGYLKMEKAFRYTEPERGPSLDGKRPGTP